VQLERVFFYLLENAVYYCGEQRAIEVRIGVEEEQEERKKLRVVVTDQGRRVGSEEREKSVGEYTTSVYGPDGLGLAICKGIIEAHRGEIRVEEGKEGGTNCTFILPAHVLLVGGEREGEERETNLGEAREPGEQERVGEKR
jgi:two-component system sensor histidine kinase KdpD